MTQTATEVRIPQVGDFLVSSWGYDQTNIDFYKVVGVTAKSVKLQQWRSNSSSIDGDFTHNAVIPGDGPRTEIDWSGVDHNADYWTQQEQKVEKPKQVLLKRFHQSGDGYYVSIASYANASLWSGHPAHETASGFGH